MELKMYVEGQEAAQEVAEVAEVARLHSSGVGPDEAYMSRYRNYGFDPANNGICGSA